MRINEKYVMGTKTSPTRAVDGISWPAEGPARAAQGISASQPRFPCLFIRDDAKLTYFGSFVVSYAEIAEHSFVQQENE